MVTCRWFYLKHMVVVNSYVNLPEGRHIIYYIVLFIHGSEPIRYDSGWRMIVIHTYTVVNDHPLYFVDHNKMDATSECLVAVIWEFLFILNAWLVLLLVPASTLQLFNIDMEHPLFVEKKSYGEPVDYSHSHGIMCSSITQHFSRDTGTHLAGWDRDSKQRTMSSMQPNVHCLWHVGLSGLD